MKVLLMLLQITIIESFYYLDYILIKDAMRFDIPTPWALLQYNTAISVTIKKFPCTESVEGT